MLPQRARVAESRVKHRSSKWTAEGAVKGILNLKDAAAGSRHFGIYSQYVEYSAT